jgi:hypothetical protein
MCFEMEMYYRLLWEMSNQSKLTGQETSTTGTPLQCSGKRSSFSFYKTILDQEKREKQATACGAAAVFLTNPRL